MKKEISRKFCVAPMMGYTTPYARKLYRILSNNSFLFSEMIATKSLIYSKSRENIIDNDFNNPVALQVGGSEIDDLTKASKIAIDYNYDEINLNVGCPSKAVQKGSFGACLMKDKILVRNCIEALQNDKIEATLKCRLGLGKELNYEFFEEFIDEISKTGIKFIYVHARNAILSGISPQGNRTIPPLSYDFVKKIKNKYPNITFILNGGINNLDKAESLLKEFDGVMVGRLIKNNPFILKEVDKKIFNEKNKSIDETIISNYFDYIKPKLGFESIFRLLSPLLNIFFSVPHSKIYKSKINDYMKDQKINLIEDLLIKFVSEKNLSLNF
ncbi:MAG: tRNA-dihydrouridine(20/20a) synthase [Alphaproteobacteria bacterium]|nr:MAG: tRNA-dihydrouridine(20/20a) synthase [Alphaproteobacteria bacterium]